MSQSPGAASATLPRPRMPAQPGAPSGAPLRRYQIASPLYAERSHDYSASDALQRLMRACRAAWEAYAELEALAASAPAGGALDQLALAAYHLWMRCEEITAGAGSAEGGAYAR